MAVVGRNEPCPCGSGRRYKTCHGALEAAAAARSDGIDALSQSALAAHQAGRLQEAAARYEALLELAPGHADALHMLGVVHYQRGLFDRALALITAALRLRPALPNARFNLELVQQALERRAVEQEIRRELAARAERAPLHPLAGRGHAASGGAFAAASDVRVIAFYLPQFHRIPENDRWWGEGFTEWTNVRRARPNFAGHAQPQVPGELGYYDLRDASVRARQAALAREHGVHGFCYYVYWFNGLRLLHEPLDAVLRSGEPDLPYCVCWANENWTRRWDGLDREILVAQTYSDDDSAAFIGALLPHLFDRRYIRIDGRPLILVYKIAAIPDAKALTRVWRDACRTAGLGEIYLAAVQMTHLDDPTAQGFDASVEFPPHGNYAESVAGQLEAVDPAWTGSALSYTHLVAEMLTLPRPSHRVFRGAMPGWDNTPRRQRDGTVFVGSTPAAFGYWCEALVAQTRLRASGDERIVFVNAWNEWAEGCRLEPEAREGRAYLAALREATTAPALPVPERPSWTSLALFARSEPTTRLIRHVRAMHADGCASVSVVMPAYNHARFVRAALDSIAGQRWAAMEIIVVDDGSSDETFDVVAAWGADCARACTLVRQANAGAHAALNRGLALARGDVIALCNSDDRWGEDRLPRLVAALDAGGASADFAFSGTRFVDDDGATFGQDVPYVESLRRALAAASGAADLLLPLLLDNIAISSGNFVFRRRVPMAIGGFASFRACHDWDFILAATYVSRLAYVPEPLYEYRLHRDNTFSGLRLSGYREGDQLLTRFFARIDAHPAMQDERSRERLLAFVDAHALSGYLPAGLRERRASAGVAKAGAATR